MVKNKKLKIFIANDSPESILALDIASKLNTYFPEMELEVINISNDSRHEIKESSLVPLFLLDGQVIHAGYPGEEIYNKIIQLSLNQYLQKHLN